MIKKITIIGGGASGWWTAAYLEKHLIDAEITLIESDILPRVGVGESTVPAVKRFFEAIGLEEKDWMDASYAIQKDGNFKQHWNDPSDPNDGFIFAFWYNDNCVFDDWIKDYFAGNKTKDQLNPDLYRSDHWAPYAYHIDAEASVSVVKNQCKNVNHVIATIEDRSQLPPADLYVDCTGFRRQFVNDLTTVDLENHLVDSCIVCPFESSGKIQNYTKTIATPYGWEFRIDLQNRQGVGNCYASRYQSDDDAMAFYKESTKDLTPFNGAKPRIIKWTPTILQNPWSGDTVAIGTSAAFVDPLEANALYMLQFEIIALARAINRGSSPAAYNRLCRKIQKDNTEFILHHYALAKRNDTAFWEYYKTLDCKKSVWNKYKIHGSTPVDAYADSTYASLALYCDEFTYYLPKKENV